jgi:hypothetical protein
MFANENAEFVRILNDAWDSSCSAPVVVEMAHFVGKHLMTVRADSKGVVNDVISSGTDSSLTNGLTDQIKVVARIKFDE